MHPAAVPFWNWVQPQHIRAAVGEEIQPGWAGSRVRTVVAEATREDLEACTDGV